MEVAVELSKKTTILFPPDLHEELVRLSRARGCSLGALVRDAVRQQYGLATREERMAAADRLAALSLPVGSVEEMIRESVPSADELLP
jgi:hypothetical protein